VVDRPLLAQHADALGELPFPPLFGEGAQLLCLDGPLPAEAVGDEHRGAGTAEPVQPGHGDEDEGRGGDEAALGHLASGRSGDGYRGGRRCRGRRKPGSSAVGAGAATGTEGVGAGIVAAAEGARPVGTGFGSRHLGLVDDFARVFGQIHPHVGAAWCAAAAAMLVRSTVACPSAHGAIPGTFANGHMVSPPWPWTAAG